MSLYDTIAVSHRGQCFALLARRFRIDEGQVADVVYALLRELTVSLDVAIADRGRLTLFLKDLGRGDYLRLLIDDSVFADQGLRDRGLRIVAGLGAIRPLDMDDIDDRAQGTGVNPATVRQMLPFVTMLMMAAVRHKAERPLRHLLAAKRGDRAATRPSDPFMTLAQGLNQPEPARIARPPVRLVDALFGRGSRPLKPVAQAAE